MAETKPEFEDLPPGFCRVCGWTPLTCICPAEGTTPEIYEEDMHTEPVNEAMPLPQVTCSNCGGDGHYDHTCLWVPDNAVDIMKHGIQDAKFEDNSEWNLNADFKDAIPEIQDIKGNHFETALDDIVAVPAAELRLNALGIAAQAGETGPLTVERAELYLLFLLGVEPS